MADAGWYGDPSGRHEKRFFTGMQWTDHVVDGSVVGHDPLVAVAVSAQPEPIGTFVLTVGDIGITPSLVVTPIGSARLAGSQWIAMDMSRTDRELPTWAIVMTVIFFFACFLGLLFLLAKEERTSGYVEVSVRSGDLYYRTQIPVSHPMHVMQARGLVNHAQALAAQAR